jgi:hypothetical protein
MRSISALRGRWCLKWGGGMHLLETFLWSTVSFFNRFWVMGIRWRQPNSGADSDSRAVDPATSIIRRSSLLPPRWQTLGRRPPQASSPSTRLRARSPVERNTAHFVPPAGCLLSARAARAALAHGDVDGPRDGVRAAQVGGGLQWLQLRVYVGAGRLPQPPLPHPSARSRRGGRSALRSLRSRSPVRWI